MIGLRSQSLKYWLQTHEDIIGLWDFKQGIIYVLQSSRDDDRSIVEYYATRDRQGIR